MKVRWSNVLRVSLLCHNFARTMCFYVLELVNSTGYDPVKRLNRYT